MTIAELGSLGELIAAVATIATLAYLAIQIRQNTLATRVANHQASIASSRAMISAIYTDPRFAAMFSRGLADFDALSHEEQIQMHFYLGQVVLFYKDNLEVNESGILDDATMDAWEEWLASILSTTGGRAWWSHANVLFIETVRTRLTCAIETATPYNDLLPFLRPPTPAA